MSHFEAIWKERRSVSDSSKSENLKKSISRQSIPPLTVRHLKPVRRSLQPIKYLIPLIKKEPIDPNVESILLSPASKLEDHFAENVSSEIKKVATQPVQIKLPIVLLRDIADKTPGNQLPKARVSPIRSLQDWSIVQDCCSAKNMLSEDRCERQVQKHLPTLLLNVPDKTSNVKSSSSSSSGEMLHIHAKKKRTIQRWTPSIHLSPLANSAELESFTEEVISRINDIAKRKSRCSSKHPDLVSTPSDMTDNTKSSGENKSKGKALSNLWKKKKGRQKKRIRLSEIHISCLEDKLPSFTNDVVARVADAGHRNVPEHHTSDCVDKNDDINVGDSSTIASSMETEKKDAWTSTAHDQILMEKDNDDDIRENISTSLSRSHDNTVPPSFTDFESETDQLEISRIAEDEAVKDALPEDQSLSQAESASFGIDMIDEPESSTLNDSLPNKTLKIRTFEALRCHEVKKIKPFEKVIHFDNDLEEGLFTPPPKRKKPRKKKSADKPNLPFSAQHVKDLVRSYATRSFSSDAMDEVVKASETYFEQTMNYLSQVSQRRSGKRKTVTLEDVEDVMKKRRHVTEERPLNIAIEENLALEYRSLLIPIARTSFFPGL